MSCGGEVQKFRLLDGFVGWDEAECSGLTGLAFDNSIGLRLAQRGVQDCKIDDPFISASDLLQYIPPRQLAHGCERCDWFLIYKKRLFYHDCCSPGWRPVWNSVCDQRLLREGVAIAARSRRIAVADRKAKRIWIWEGDGNQLIASINTDNLSGIASCHPHNIDRIDELGALAFTPWGDLLVADVKNHSIWQFSFSGDLLGLLPIALPDEKDSGPIDRIAVSRDCSIWVITGDDDQYLQLWRAERSDKAFSRSTLAELEKTFDRIGLAAANKDQGFCIEECGREGFPVSKCFKWNGQPATEPIESPKPPPRYEQGQLLTRAIDSGSPRCRWHRLRLDAEVPSGTTLEVAVATNEGIEDEEITPKGDRTQETGWESFAAGAPHHLDWQVARTGSLDFLINQPPGRFLYLRLRFRGNGEVTPVVTRIRLDFPRVTSLDLLPPVYRDNPIAEDFTERFLALFDASIADLDRAIERAPALLDPEGVPDGVLPWIGSFLDLAFDPEWKPELRRKILKALPQLYRREEQCAGSQKRSN
jgi:phage tail-like protein